MSLPMPSWRLAPRGTSLSIRLRVHHTRPLHLTPSRGAADSDDKPNDGAPKRPNPILEEYLRNNPTSTNPAQQPPQGQVAGDLPASSVFEDDRRAQQQTLQAETSTTDASTPSEKDPRRNPENILRVVDPDPNSRERWERKKVIQLVRRGGRLSKREFVARTEREHLVKSHNLKTSVKKLGMLARQIQGKTIEDAITQMRFSRKKVATEVMKQLEFARDEAVVMRGMGLGGAKAEGEADEAGVDGAAAAQSKEKGGKTAEIQLKDGKRHRVTDPSKIYIDQAWVGRGPYGKLPDYRARGRLYIMRTPWTSISLLLKEEATRVREHAEREAKRRRQTLENVWVHLPDRPIQTKSQWYSW